MGSDEILKETREWHVKHREKGLLIPEEIQSECILAIGCLMRSDQLATYKGKWVEYFVHSCKSTDPHISSKALAALANVASFGLAQLRLIEHSRDYCERSIVISREEVQRGLNILPTLTEFVRVVTSIIAPRREAAKVFAWVLPA